ncbi:pyruvate ferredoxin oxidoreductase [Candidatus Woesearchaeota archaeon]|nr:pyruvate ferredoxin oxidoreductase [Candidatus Woesearchaeota archaeon]
MNIKELGHREKRFVSGHRSCAGCGFPTIVRNVLAGTKEPVVVSCATGCLEVTSTIYPFTSWKVPFIHSAFENTSATISGVEATFKAFKKRGKLKENVKFVAFGGDGGTYDIGLQSLSGALERGHDFLYVLYDNEGYMNTGNQRSSATPYGADTTTEPEGKLHHGKEEFRKDITKIAVAHNIPYIAQTACHAWNDTVMKAEKAFSIKGPKFINVLSPCTLNWKIDTSITVEISRLATETCFWPLYEVENGKYKLNYRPKVKLPIEEFLRPQGRFKHLFKPENLHIIKKIQENVDSEWKKLLKLCGES